jgi:hypothetical protein
MIWAPCAQPLTEATTPQAEVPAILVVALALIAAFVAALKMFEEHAALFGPAMSRLFGIAFPDERFVLIFVFALPTLYYLTAIGRLLRIPLAGFVAWFIFIGPGIAEFTHFIFPLITPALEPANPAPINAVIDGVRIEGCAAWWTFRNRNASLSEGEGEKVKMKRAA